MRGTKSMWRMGRIIWACCMPKTQIAQRGCWHSPLRRPSETREQPLEHWRRNAQRRAPHYGPLVGVAANYSASAVLDGINVDTRNVSTGGMAERQNWSGRYRVAIFSVPRT